MTNSEAVAVTHPLAGRLESCGVTHVAIIDDAYDPPTTQDVPEQVRAELWTYIEHDEAALGRLRELGVPLERLTDLTDEAIDRLWRRRRELGPVEGAWQATIGPLLETRRGALDSLTKRLRELKLTVQTLGLEDHVQPPAHLVFLDYYMGPVGPESVQRAITQAKTIHDECPTDATKPILVLMSSHGEVVQAAEQFRRKSGFVGGMFHCIMKGDLQDSYTLDLHLHTFALSLPTAHELQRFADAMFGKMKEVAEQFNQDIRELTVSDYAYIQRLSLQEDGHPLGDYILWLFGTYFGHLLFGAGLKDERAALDRLVFDVPLPSPAMPSSRLVELYSCALFDRDVGPLRPHPRAPAEAGDEALALYLGDFFLRDTEALMVINAQCDLAFAPDAERPIPPLRRVLMLPGRLQPLSAKAEGRWLPRTELFQHDGQLFRVLWRMQELVAVPFSDIGRWLREKGYERVARLRLPYALEVQRAFAADLTRIGMPVAPPLYQPVSIEILHCVDGRLAVLRDPDDLSAFLTITEKGVQCVLTKSIVIELRAEIDVRIRNLQESPDQGDTMAAQRRIRLIAAVDNHEAWAALLPPQKMPHQGKSRQLESLPIWLAHGADSGGACPSNQMELMVNIVTMESTT